MKISENLSLVKTEDESYTLIKDGNRMHAKQGALKESKKKYVNPMLEHHQKKNKNRIKILDIGTGMGYNSIMSLKSCKEKDLEAEIDTIDKFDYSIKTKGSKISSKIQANISSENIHFHKMDAREFVERIEESEIYDVIYLDPFPPSENPELYSLHFFNSLKNLLNRNGVLLTYNASYACRAGLVFSGFEIGGMRRMEKEMTVATKKAFDYSDIDRKNELILGLTDIGIPYIDPNLNWDRERIKDFRWDLRDSARNEFLLSSSNKCPLQIFESNKSMKKDLDNFGITEEELKELIKVEGSSSEKIRKIRYNILSH